MAANMKSYPCPNCGAQQSAEKVNSELAWNCENCGQAIQPGYYSCPQCHGPLLVIRQTRQLVRYCEHCDMPIEIKQGLPPLSKGEEKPRSQPQGDVTIINTATSEKCDNCNAVVPAEARFCPNCGRKLCPQCHVSNVREAKFCHNCGNRLI